MGISERREKEKTERRKAILSCAKELIHLKGIERVSMEEIARKAELSKATVYLYFSSKEVLLNEICEESARIFLEYIKSSFGKGVPSVVANLSGLQALKYFWQGFVELFGNSEEMIIIFSVHRFLDPSLPNFLLKEQNKSSNVVAIITTIKNLIDRCKADGVFDPDLDSGMATNLLLSMFYAIAEKATRLPPENRNFSAILDEMTKAFQIVIHGFAKEEIDRSILDISKI